MLSGACECGAVRYEVADAFLHALNCHCSPWFEIADDPPQSIELE
jgi:hypothetical protein